MIRDWIRSILFFPYACQMILGRAFYPVLVVIGLVLCVGIAIGYLIRGG